VDDLSPLSGGRGDDEREEHDMPRYLVERAFPGGLAIPTTPEGAQACLGVVDNNAGLGVTWIHSYVTPDRDRTFCIYDAPDPEAIRTAAGRNDLPVDSITEVRVLDPYFYV
jgi:hypothetical protein